MKQEMLNTLSKYFAANGRMDQSTYVSRVDKPYDLRDIKRVFKRYEAMVEEALAVVHKPAPKVVEKPVTKPATKVE